MPRALVVVMATVLSATCAIAQPAAPTAPYAIVGATLLDVANGGESAHDVANAVVVIRSGTIVAAGPAATVPIPPDARIIDAHGKFLVPGLIDGFGGMNSQAQADATLYMGVTTIVGISADDRRGVLLKSADPAPQIMLMESAGIPDEDNELNDDPVWKAKLKEGPRLVELSRADTGAELQALAKRGVRVILVWHSVSAENAKFIIARSHQLGMVTYGELISTPFSAALTFGVDSLLHMTRYELGLLPPAIQQPLIVDPEEDKLGAAYDYLAKLDPAGAPVVAYGKHIHDAGVALMPTFSLEYLEMPDHRNLWKEPAAAILDPKTLHRPPDPQTGDITFSSPQRRDASFALVAQFWAINRTIERQHPLYLCASGSSALGTMPGISMHTELELLVRLGLTPREALAAATNNYAVKFGWHDVGLIAPGRRADIVVLDADPTVDIANSRRIDDVYLNGERLDRAAFLRR
jgi:hypothetical protein